MRLELWTLVPAESAAGGKASTAQRPLVQRRTSASLETQGWRGRRLRFRCGALTAAGAGPPSLRLIPDHQNWGFLFSGAALFYRWGVHQDYERRDAPARDGC